MYLYCADSGVTGVVLQRYLDRAPHVTHPKKDVAKGPKFFGTFGCFPKTDALKRTFFDG
jgi:hypothetical protein